LIDLSLSKIIKKDEISSIRLEVRMDWQNHVTSGTRILRLPGDGVATVKEATLSAAGNPHGRPGQEIPAGGPGRHGVRLPECDRMRHEEFIGLYERYKQLEEVVKWVLANESWEKYEHAGGYEFDRDGSWRRSNVWRAGASSRRDSRLSRNRKRPGAGRYSRRQPGWPLRKRSTRKPRGKNRTGPITGPVRTSPRCFGRWRFPRPVVGFDRFLPF
jgi:hypothetical protein